MFHYRCFAAFLSAGWFQRVTDGCRPLDFCPPVADSSKTLQMIAAGRGSTILSKKLVLSPYL
jgi:hypothetical protein